MNMVNDHDFLRVKNAFFAWSIILKSPIVNMAGYGSGLHNTEAPYRLNSATIYVSNYWSWLPLSLTVHTLIDLFIKCKLYLRIFNI